MSNHIERAIQLKQMLVDFVYDAEDELAVALETYAAAKSRRNSYGIKQQNLTTDLFITEGRIKEQNPLAIFLEQADNLTAEELKLMRRWGNNFIGLFEILDLQENSYKLMNWLTAKEYQVYGHSGISQKETNRWQPGEIILTIIAPLNDRQWFLFSDRIIKGRLSKPKLAVAIGEFRDNYPEFLYADAPELLEQAWESVAIYHQEFVAYFGSDFLTLPGYKLNQKIGELQQIMSKKLLAKAGIDDSKSVAEILTESGATAAELTENAAELGVDSQEVENLLKSKNKLSMVTPKVDLPTEIKQAETVTVFSHPRWGQMFLPNYEKFTKLLTSDNIESQENSDLLIRKYLEQPQANYYVWQHLKQKYPQALAKLLQSYTKLEQFNLETDLEQLLLEYDKSSTPQLPSIASVPIHLNNLFEEAVAQVQKSKSKTKKKKPKKGFLS